MNALFNTVRALIIAVICLAALLFTVHAVAVAGIYAFNSYQHSHPAHPAQN